MNRRPISDRQRLDRATTDLDPPFALVDLDAFDGNAEDLVRRAGGTPIRLASKSLRCRHLLDDALARPGFRGVMSYALAEAVWLAEHGVEDILMAYPSADRRAFQALAKDPELCRRITLMVDDVDHLDFVDRVLGERRPELRVCLDLDASWRPLGVHVGVRRSPLREPVPTVALAREAVRRPGFALVGLMTYEAQIAGLQDLNSPIRMMKARSAAEIAQRRAAVVAAVREVAPLEIVNAGGTGSLETSAADPIVTEVTAGSGLYGPTLFDRYRGFRPRPAPLFALPVVRRPAPEIATLFGGGYVASGQAGRDRLPTPYLPDGLELVRVEGAGEVQTPVTGRAAGRLRVGDRVWMRHTKAGEMCERFDALHLVRGDQLVDTVATYRGEGKNFG
ncbi:MAG: amino acid deaminase/aldolase [Propionibacteriales bacterium]|nr:amino acid deaminase/aldolase [Propionibacteriales bacterium]